MAGSSHPAAAGLRAGNRRCALEPGVQHRRGGRRRQCGTVLLHGGWRGQRGAVLLTALTVALLAGTSVLLARIEHTAALRARETAATTRALADARRALIGWSVGAGLSGSGVGHTPGILPFPDRNTDARGYDGRADCVTSWLSDRHLIGRFASAGETSPCPARVLGVEFRDGSGELLWYAVSRNLVNHRGGSSPDAPINPGLLDETPAFPGEPVSIALTRQHQIRGSVQEFLQRLIWDSIGKGPNGATARPGAGKWMITSSPSAGSESG